MQATVRHFDPVTRSGELVFDDGTLVQFDRDAFDRSGLRLLRLGQRVRLVIEDGRVVFLTIATM